MLSLTGDIDLPTARLSEKYLGAIPAGPRSRRPPAPVPTLPKRIDDAATDRVSTPHLYRAWAVPGVIAPDAAAFTIAAGTMTMPDGMPIRERLIERDKLFTSLFNALEHYDAGGTLSIHGSVAPGVDAAVAGRALDAAIERFLTAELITRIQHAAMPGAVSTGWSRGCDWARDRTGMPGGWTR